MIPCGSTMAPQSLHYMLTQKLSLVNSRESVEAKLKFFLPPRDLTEPRFFPVGCPMPTRILQFSTPFPLSGSAPGWGSTDTNAAFAADSVYGGVLCSRKVNIYGVKLLSHSSKLGLFTFRLADVHGPRTVKCIRMMLTGTVVSCVEVELSV